MATVPCMELPTTEDFKENSLYNLKTTNAYFENFKLEKPP